MHPITLESVAVPSMPRTPPSVAGAPLQTGGVVSVSTAATPNRMSSIPNSSKMPPRSSPEVMVTRKIGRSATAPKNTGVDSLLESFDRVRVAVLSSRNSNFTEAGVASGR